MWGVAAAFICTGPWVPPPHPQSPAVPGSEQTSREESGPASVARFSLRCPARVSLPSLSRLLQEGRQPQDRQAQQVTLVLWRRPRPRARVCAVLLPERDVLRAMRFPARPGPGFPRVSVRSLLHLLGLKLVRGAGTAYPRDTPSSSLPGKILRQAPPPRLPFPHVLVPAWIGLP